LVSSRARSRTKTLVSMARMALSHEATYAGFHRCPASGWWRSAGKYGRVNLGGTDATRTAYHNLPFYFAPFERGSRSDTEPLPHFRWN
jgi:hypothetical protein